MNNKDCLFNIKNIKNFAYPKYKHYICNRISILLINLSIMKTKVNVGDELEKLVKKMNDGGAKGTFLSVYFDTQERELSISLSNDDDDDLVCALAAIISTAYNGNTKNEGIVRTGHALVEAVAMAAKDHSSLVGLKVVTDFTTRVLMEDEPSNDEDEHEDCEHCENNRTCQLSDAIAYRKANGISKPKNKKHGGNNNNAN